MRVGVPSRLTSPASRFRICAFRGGFRPPSNQSQFLVQKEYGRSAVVDAAEGDLRTSGRWFADYHAKDSSEGAGTTNDGLTAQWLAKVRKFLHLFGTFAIDAGFGILR